MMTFTLMRLGAFGNSYNNALVATVNRLYKSEVIEYLKERWHGVNDVELATFKCVDGCKKRRVHSTIDYVSLFEF